MMNPPLAIEIDLTPESLARVARLRNMPFILRRALTTGMDEAAALTVSDIQSKRLTGKGPFPADEGRLGQVTRRLRTSVRFTPAKAEGNVVHQTIGTNVPYAHVHEFGFNGQVHVPAFTRRQRSRDVVAQAQGPTKSGRVTKRKVVVASGFAHVKGHTRWMQLGARAPFGHGLADNVTTYTRVIDGALRDAVRTHLEPGGTAQP